jgi:hypothetical protein
VNKIISIDKFLSLNKTSHINLCYFKPSVGNEYGIRDMYKLLDRDQIVFFFLNILKIGICQFSDLIMFFIPLNNEIYLKLGKKKKNLFYKKR